MRHLLRSVRLFLLLFEVAGLPPLAAVLQGVAVIATWLFIADLAPGLHEYRAFSWSVMAFLVVGFSLNLPSSIARVESETLNNVVKGVVLVWAGLFVMFLLVPDPIWFQRTFTVASVLSATGYLIDIADRKYDFAKSSWPQEELANARPALARVFFLKHLAFALLNETLIATVESDVWLIYLALLPMLNFYVSYALITTVLLDLEPSN